MGDLLPPCGQSGNATFTGFKKKNKKTTKKTTKTQSPSQQHFLWYSLSLQRYSRICVNHGQLEQHG